VLFENLVINTIAECPMKEIDKNLNLDGSNKKLEKVSIPHR